MCIYAYAHVYAQICTVLLNVCARINLQSSFTFTTIYAYDNLLMCGIVRFSSSKCIRRRTQFHIIYKATLLLWVLSLMCAYWLTKPSLALPMMTVNYLSLYLSFFSETTANKARIRNLKKSETIVWKNKVAVSLTKDPFNANDTLLLTSPVALSFSLFLKSKREKILHTRGKVSRIGMRNRKVMVLFSYRVERFSIASCECGGQGRSPRSALG